MKVDIHEEKIETLLTRGVGEYIDPDGSFRKKLLTNPEKIIIKFGVDPTRPDIHLGHAVVLRTLRQFQDLGCKVIFLIGDYTAQIGDPTGKSKVRPEIDQAEVEKNMQTYLEQVGKILKIDPTVFSWIRNSDWFTAITDLGFPKGQITKIDDNFSIEANSLIGKAHVFQQTRMQTKDLQLTNMTVITLRSFLWTLKHITHSRLIERDMFKDRLEKNEELYLHEMMYPVLQGIDSYALNEIYGNCDLEVGGTDQTFNMIVGRDVMKMNGKVPQAVLSFKLLIGTDGKEKMSKSLDNYISIIDEPNDMYGKVLSIPDALIVNYFELCTFTPMDRISEIEMQIKEEKVNPKDLKMELAKQIVAIYHGEALATEAQEDWVTKFQKKEIPEVVDHIVYTGSFADTLVIAAIVPSKTEYRRLIEQGAITDIERDIKIIDPSFVPEETAIYRIGKHRFVKIVVG